MASSAMSAVSSRSSSGGSGNVQYSVFPDAVYVDASSSVHRGIRWSTRRVAARRGRKERKAAARAQRALHNLPASNGQAEALHGDHSTEADVEASASVRSASSPSDPNEALERASAASSSPSSDSLSSPFTDSAESNTGAAVTVSAPVFVKCARPGVVWPAPAAAPAPLRSPGVGLAAASPPPAKQSLWPQADLRHSERLETERLICGRIASLRPVELVPETALRAEHFDALSDGTPSASAMALVWTDHGGQPLTDLWPLHSHASASHSPPALELPRSRLRVHAGGDAGEEERADPPLRVATHLQLGSTPAPSLKLPELLHFAVALAERMDEVHSAGVVYNFLHPAMVLYKHVGDDGHVQLLDYTYAVQAAGRDSPNTAAVSPLFPPPQHFLPYVAPERFDLPEWPSCSPDVRSDLYSVGALLYELCSGSPPFTSTDFRRMRHLHRAKLPQPPAFPKEWTLAQCADAACVGHLSDVIQKLLAKGVEQRYQSSAGLLYDLRHLLTLALSQAQALPAPFSVGAMDRASTFRVVCDHLYGRDQQLQQLLAVTAESTLQPPPSSPSTRRCHLALVQGEAGSGKTALLAELQRRVQQRGDLSRVLPMAFTRFRANAESADGVQCDSSAVLLLKSLKALVIQALTVKEDVGYGRSLLSTAVAGREKLCLALLPELKPFLDHLPSTDSNSLLAPSAIPHALSPTSPPELSPLPEPSGEEVCALVMALLRAFCGPSNCLILLLDDVDACDAQCTAFLQSLLQPQALGLAELPHCALVATYTSVPPSAASSPPLSCSNSALLSLPPLTVSAVSLLLRDSLAAASTDSILSSADVDELASLLLLKTSGLPLELHRALHSLYAARLLHFDYARGAWRWQVEAIKTFDLGPLAPALLHARVAALTPEQNRALRVASCIGAEFSVAAIAFCFALPYHRLASLLAAGVQYGLVLPCSKGLTLPPLSGDDGDVAGEEMRLRFAHPLIRDRFYELCSLPFRQHVHLTYARSFLQAADGQLQKQVELHVLDIVHHYELSVGLLLPRPPPPPDAAAAEWDFDSEMQKVQELKQVVMFALAASRAAHRARNAAVALQHARFAYSTCQSLVHFSQSVHTPRLAGSPTSMGGASFPSLWLSDYDLCLAVFREYGSLLYASGDVEQADSVVSIALLHSNTTLDHVRLHDLRLDAALIRGDHNASIQTGLQVLELLGMRLHPYNAAEMAQWVNPQSVAGLLADAEGSRSGSGDSALYQSHTDATVQASLYISRLLMPSWLDGRYFHDVLATSAQLLHRHGLTLYHPQAIAFYSAALLAQHTPAVEQADTLCRCTLDYFHDSLDQYAAADKAAARLEQLLVSTVFLQFVSPWKTPLRESLEQFEDVQRGLLALMPEITSRSRIALSHVDFHYRERLHWSGAPIPRVLAAQQDALSSSRGRAVLLYKEFYSATGLLLSALHKGAARVGETEGEGMDGSTAVTANGLRSPEPVPVDAASSLLDVSLAVEQRMTRLVASALPPVLTCIGRVWLLQWYFLTANHAAALLLWPQLRAGRSPAVTLVTQPQALFYTALSTAAMATDSIHDTGAGGPEVVADPTDTSAPDLVQSLQALLLDARRVYAEAAHNFEHKWALLEAELVKLRTWTADADRTRAYLPALVLYDRAITGARNCGCVADEAIACELAGRFALMHSRHVEAAHYLQLAVVTFRVWGCTVKVHALLMEFGDLIATWSTPAARSRGATVAEQPLVPQSLPSASNHSAAVAVPYAAPAKVGGGAGGGSWGEDSLIKMTQTFSVETDVAVLLRKLLRIVLREAGASRCRLLLCRELRWTVHLTAVLEQGVASPVEPSSADASVGDGADGMEEDIRFITHGEAPGSADYAEVAQVIPRSLLQYSLSTLSSLSLGHADIARGPFSIDPYLVSQRPRACTIIPIVRHAQAVVVLYLEDDHGTAPILAESMAGLQFVCSQAALSLENASYTAALLAKNHRLEDEVRLRVEAVGAMTRAKEAAEKADQVKSEFLSSMRSATPPTSSPCAAPACSSLTRPPPRRVATRSARH